MNRSTLGRASAVLILVPLLACEDLSVTTVPVSRVEVVPGAATLTVGESLALEAIPADANGTPLTDRSVAWKVRDPSLAIVSSTGTVHALEAGVTVVEATTEGKTGATEIQIVSFEPPQPPEEDAGDPTEDGSGDDDGDGDGADGGGNDRNDDDDDDSESGKRGKKKGHED